MIAGPNDIHFEGLPSQLPLQVQRTPPSMDDVFRADFWRNSTIGSTVQYINEISQRTGTAATPGYDALDDINGYEQDASAFIDSQSAAETAIIKSFIDRDRENQRTIAAGGDFKSAVAGLLSGAVDPTTYIPFVGWETKGATLGARFLSGAAKGAIGGAEAGIASETILQATQHDRPIGESFQNIAAYSIFGGVLGGGLGLMTRGEKAAAIDDIQRDFSPVPRSGGAAAVDVRTSEGLSPKPSGLDWFMTNRVTGNPISRGVRSSYLGVQRAFADLADLPEHLRTEGSGVPVTEGGSAEARTKAWYGMAGRMDAMLRDQYKAYRQRLKAEGGKPLNREDFYQAVTQSTHREAGLGVPEVDTAAAQIRKGFYDPALAAGQETGLIGKGMQVAADYGHRVWNHDRIAVDSVGLIEKIEEHIRGLRDSKFLANIRDKVTKLESTIEAQGEKVKLLALGAAKDVAGAKAALRAERLKLAHMRSDHALQKNRAEELEEVSSASDDAIREFTNRAVNHIQIGSFGRGLTSPELRSAFKYRLLDFIPNNELEPWLDMNISHVIGHYIHFVAPDIELARKFGTPSMEDVIGRIEADAREQINNAPAIKRPAMEKELNYQLNDLKAARDVQRNVYALPKTPTGARSLRALTNAGILRAGGSFLISSVPDIARPATIFGMRRFFEASLGTLVKRLQSPEFRVAMSKVTADLRDMGAANELLRNERMLSFANAFTDYSHMSKSERAIQWMSDRYGKVTGMSYWNQYFKQVSGLLSTNKTLEDVVKLAGGKELNAKAQRRLDFLGISPELAIQIADQFAKHGETVEGLKNANWAEWSNSDAARAFQAATVKDVDRTILTPGTARPLWMGTPTGRLVGQFRSFTADAMNKIVVAGLQERDAAQLAGLAFNVVLGGMVYVTKLALKGAGFVAALDAMTGESFLLNAIDQSGLGGWFFEADNIQKQFSGRSVPNWVHYAAGDDTGAQPISRWSAAHGLSSLAGPTARAFEEVASGSSGILESFTSGQDVSANDIRRIKRNLVPYQNLWWMRVLIDAVEQAAGESPTLEVLK